MKYILYIGRVCIAWRPADFHFWAPRLMNDLKDRFCFEEKVVCEKALDEITLFMHGAGFLHSPILSASFWLCLMTAAGQSQREAIQIKGIPKTVKQISHPMTTCFHS